MPTFRVSVALRLSVAVCTVSLACECMRNSLMTLTVINVTIRWVRLMMKMALLSIDRAPNF